MTDTLITIENLKTYFYTDAGVAKAVDGISLEIPKGKTMALVGESGCGKSVTALSIMRLVPDPPGRIVEGRIMLGGQDLAKLPERAMRRLRGNEISMIFQEPMTSLNPVFRVGDQVADILRLHKGMSKKEGHREAVELFRRVGIPSPEDRINDFPHQMSGGMRQRVMIAMALACGPSLLIADEPTTALDVTIQAQILDLLRDLQQAEGMSILLITHDLGVVAEIADEVAIMYAAKIVERAPARDLFQAPQHPYTVGLFESLPSLGKGGEALHSITGRVPPATHFPKGCRFHPRCPFAMDICPKQEPPLMDTPAGPYAACWLHHESTMQDQGRAPGLPQTEGSAYAE